MLSFGVFKFVVKDLTVLFVIAPNRGLLPFALMMYSSFCAYIRVPFISLACFSLHSAFLTVNFNQGME